MSVAAALSSLLLFLNLQDTTPVYIYRGNQKPSLTKSCSFANPSYAGVCVITPAAGETCEMILSYLNNPLGVGKTYCANTSVRGGWKQVPSPIRSQKTKVKSRKSEGKIKKS